MMKKITDLEAENRTLKRSVEEKDTEIRRLVSEREGIQQAAKAEVGTSGTV